MDASLERSLDDVIEALRHSRDTRQRGCSLLIGAGCSATAGIATAAGFVRIIEGRFKAAHSRAANEMASGPPGYPQCMAKLSRGQQRDLINEQVCAARINWAHMAIAQLMKHGYVDRVLTTNFDPLVLRACAMLGEFPAVYDFAISQLFKPGELPKEAIFHLHGQSTGFVLMNTGQEVAKHSRRLGPLFYDAVQARPWIVVGYSGDNDPVFNHLAGIERFDYPLFWVGFKDEVPARHVREKLLRPGRDAYFVRGYDADGFFVELAQKLDCFPPQFVERPFSFMLNALSALTEYRLPPAGEKIDILHQPRELIGQAISYFENNQPGSFTLLPSQLSDLAATALLMAGKYEQLQHLARGLGDDISQATRDLIAWSYIQQGNALSNQAKTKSGVEADALFASAGKKYEAALAIKPDKHEALKSWGAALAEQAEAKGDTEAEALFGAAFSKFAAALEMMPRDYEALYNWGNTLLAQAATKSGAAADTLFASAGGKYAAALAIKPNDHEALNNWGNALLAQAATKSGEAAETLFALAGEKYAAALAIKPDDHEALYNWGNAFLVQARTKRDEAVEALCTAAGEKYAAALAIKPDKHEALNNWGNALLARATAKSGEAADTLFTLAGEKYAAALVIKPDSHEVLNNWGFLYVAASAQKSGLEVERMLKEAEGKLLAAEEIKNGSGAYILACLSARRGNAGACQSWLRRAKDHGRLPDKELLLRDPDLAAVRDEAWFQAFLSEF